MSGATVQGAKRPEQFHILTSLRGILAVQIVAFHFSGFWLIEPNVPRTEYGPIFSHIHVTVDMFFLLSGFIMAHVHGKEFLTGFDRGIYRRYLWLRIARIYPLHILVLAGFLALEFLNVAIGDPNAFKDLDRTPQSVISNILLIHSWGIEPNLTWNYPSWSISVEWSAYLLFPLFVWIFLKRSAIFAAASTVGIFAVMYWLWSLDPDLGLDRTYDWGVVRGLCSFAFGLVLYRFYQGVARHWEFNSSVMTVVGIAGFIFLPLAFYLDFHDLAIFALYGPFIILFLMPENRLKGWLENKPLIFLGDISYALYMVHALVQRVFAKLVHMGWIKYEGFWTSVAFALFVELVAIIISIGVYYWFEKPTRRYVRKMFAENKAKREAVSPAQ